MKKVFTMKELEARYSGEWVLLVNPIHSKLMEPVRGELVFHSKDRDEVYKEALKRKDALTAKCRRAAGSEHPVGAADLVFPEMSTVAMWLPTENGSAWNLTRPRFQIHAVADR